MPNRMPIAVKAACLIGLLISRPVSAQNPAPAASPTRNSIQEDFNKATDAATNKRCAEALPIFARLIADPRLKPGSLPAAAVAVRRGNCLIDTGSIDAGAASIELGLPILAKAGPNFVEEVAEAELALGDVAMERWQHDTAVSHYKAALALQEGNDRLRPLIALAKITSFDGGPEPLAYVDEALRIADAAARPDKKTQAAFHTVRGRILMNQGQNKEARTELRKALDLSGGLTSRITMADATMRGDLALAALLNGDKTNARLYLAYTGAGRITQSPFAVAAEMAPPPCGSETGLRPEDSAIVEFAIGDNGDVSVAQTVYSQGNYAVASAFAKAVSAWYWRPDDLARIPPFYRLLTRVELRCSNNGGDVAALSSGLKERVGTWAARVLPLGSTVSVGPRGGEMARFGALAAEQEKSGNIPATAAALALQALIDPKPSAVTLQRMDRAFVLAGQANLPDEPVNALRVLRAMTERAVARRDKSAPEIKTFVDGFMQLAADDRIARDALASDTLLLAAVPQKPREDQRQATYGTLKRVADDSRLSEHHPLRQVALLQLANLAAGEKDFAAADGYFKRTGLTEQQCALIGAKPALRSSGADSSDYPEEALMMGFEGWVSVEFDITAEGRTANARPIIAYPPFVFVDAVRGMMSAVRYTASYRPSGGQACAADQETIRFITSARR